MAVKQRMENGRHIKRPCLSSFRSFIVFPTVIILSSCISSLSFVNHQLSINLRQEQLIGVETDECKYSFVLTLLDLLLITFLGSLLH